MNFGRGHYRLNPDHSVEPFEVRTEADLVEWARGLGRQDWRVAWTEIGPGITVSTVFLGLDHSHGLGPPQLFETMTFDDYGGGNTWRYSSWAEAAAGHDRAVAELRALVEARPSPVNGR